MSGKYSIAVTLTDTQRPEDIRFLTLTSGVPVSIGRSSKRELKNLQPSPTNALFDCPVVSRTHAELKANPWASADDQVTITDKGSMHGTHVNGKEIEKNKPMSLRSGDTIKFGTNIARGIESHDGVIVTFHKTEPSKPAALGTGFTSATTRGYHAPDYSAPGYDSDDESDGAYSPRSDDDEDGNNHAASSAKTTPEQVKSYPGSAAQPIDVDSIAHPPRPTVIDLDDDDEYIPPPPAAPRFYKTIFPPQIAPTSAQPSKSNDVPDLVVESVNKTRDWEPLSPMPPVTPPSNDGLLNRGFLLPIVDKPPPPSNGVLNSGFLAATVDRLPRLNLHTSASSREEEVNNLVKAALGPGNVIEEEGELHSLSDEEISDLDDQLEPPFEDDEPHSYSTKRQVSLELESPLASQQLSQRPPVDSMRPETFAFTPYEPISMSVSQPLYDPVRSSQTLPQPSGLSQFSQPFGPWTSHHQAWLTNIDGEPLQRGFLPPTMTRPNIYMDGHGLREPPRDAPVQTLTTPNASFVGVDSSRGAKSAKSRITIPELVDELIEEPLLVPQNTTSALPVSSFAEEAGLPRNITTGTKRKADEISADDEYPITQSEALREAKETLTRNLDKVLGDIEVAPSSEAPARKKMKVRSQPSIAGTVMKYAAVAVAGGAATVAFLLSSAPESLGM